PLPHDIYTLSLHDALPISSVLEETDSEVDLASLAYQIWKNAVDADPKLQKIIPELPNVVFSTKPHAPSPEQPDGVLVYMRTADKDRKSTRLNSSHRTISYA